MSKRIRTLLAALLVLSFTVLAVASGGSDDSAKITTKEGETAAPAGENTSKERETAAPAGEKNPVQNGKGTIGKYEIEIISADKAKDYAGKNVIVITYKWTNNSDSATSFMMVFRDKVYQDGVECASTVVMKGDGFDKQSADIKAGAALEVKVAYKLNDDSDISVEVEGLLSFSDEKVEKTFSVK